MKLQLPHPYQLMSVWHYLGSLASTMLQNSSPRRSSHHSAILLSLTKENITSGVAASSLLGCLHNQKHREAIIRHFVSSCQWSPPGMDRQEEHSQLHTCFPCFLNRVTRKFSIIRACTREISGHMQIERAEAQKAWRHCRFAGGCPGVSDVHAVFAHQSHALMLSL